MQTGFFRLTEGLPGLIRSGAIYDYVKGGSNVAGKGGIKKNCYSGG